MIFLLSHLRKEYAAVQFGAMIPRWSRFGDIFRVGILSSIGALQSGITTVLITGFVGVFGTKALAGYGIASRVDIAMIPLLFGLGTAITVLVAMNLGAGSRDSARRFTWFGAFLGFIVAEIIGVCVALFPGAWMMLFTKDTAALEFGGSYLRIVGPIYGALGFSLVLYFAAQGAGKPMWPFLAGFVRILLTISGGWFLMQKRSSSLGQLFIVVGIGLLIATIINAVAMMRITQFKTYASDQTAAGLG